MVNGIGRVGPATLQEAELGLSLGANVGLIVPPDDYQHIIDYMLGRTDEYSAGLPAYTGLDLDVGDIIPGFEGLTPWLLQQQSQNAVSSPRGRSLKSIDVQQMILYGHSFAGEDPAELALLGKIIDIAS